MNPTPQRAAERRSTPGNPGWSTDAIFAPSAFASERHSVTLCSGMHDGSPAVLISTPSHVVFVSMQGGAARRVMSLGIRHVVLVDETASSTGEPYAEVTVLAARATITLTRVDRLRAVDFCNAVRLAILYEAAHRDTPAGRRGASRSDAKPSRRHAASGTR